MIKILKETKDGEQIDEVIFSKLGKIYVGDICYALDQQMYDEVWGNKYQYANGKFEVRGSKNIGRFTATPENYNDGGIAKYFGSFAVDSTAYGDGTYKGTDGKEYSVDAGVIGVVPQELWKSDVTESELNRLGTVLNTNQCQFCGEMGYFEIYYNGGKYIHIDTMNEEEYEEYEENEEYEEYEESFNRKVLRENDTTYRYQLLSRLQSDCDYYLGYGGRNEKYLWALGVNEQIAKMKELYNSFPNDKKPEWISMQDIENYEKRMKNDI